jgi:hypothetical protein
MIAASPAIAPGCRIGGRHLKYPARGDSRGLGDDVVDGDVDGDVVEPGFGA